jgi:hypothetical protein
VPLGIGWITAVTLAIRPGMRSTVLRARIPVGAFLSAAAFVRSAIVRHRRRVAMQAAERVALDEAAALPDARPVLWALVQPVEQVSLGAVARSGIEGGPDGAFRYMRRCDASGV